MAKVLDSATKGKDQRTLSDNVNIMAGQMLTFENLMDTKEGGSVKVLTDAAQNQRRLFGGCVLLPLALFQFVTFTTSVMLAEDITNVYLIESELRAMVDDMFSEAESIDDIWDGIQGSFVDTVFNQEDSYGSPLSRGNVSDNKFGMWGRVKLYNQIQGPVRFTQSRSELNAYGKPYVCTNDILCFLCRTNVGFQRKSMSVKDTWDCGDWLGRRLGSDAEVRVPDSETGADARRMSLMSPPMDEALPNTAVAADNFQFYIYPSETKDEINSRLQYYRDRQWLDGKTMTFSISMYIINAELTQPVMEQITLWFYMSEGGSVYYARDLQPIFFNVFPSSLGMVVMGFWLLSFITGVIMLILGVIRECRAGRAYEVMSDIRTLFEILTTIVGIYMCIQFIIVTVVKSQMTDIVNQVRSHGWNLLDAQSDVADELFQRGEAAAENYLSLRKFFAAYSIILCFRTYSPLAPQPRLGIITKTLTALIVDILHFLVLYIPCFLVYVTSATLLFGRHMEGHSTFLGSLGSTFRMAQEGEYEWEGFKAEYYWTSALWIWSFIIFINMLLINLLMAIILDVYTDVQGSEASEEPAWDTLLHLGRRTLNFREWIGERLIEEKCAEPSLAHKVLTPGTMKAWFPTMPEYQLASLATNCSHNSTVESDKYMNDESLIKAMGSMMSSAAGVSRRMGEIIEESKDSLQSWVVPGKPLEAIDPSSQGECAPPVETKGSRPARIVKEEAVQFNTSKMEWSPEWLREVDDMLKAQRSWVTYANYQLDQLLCGMQNSDVAKQ